MALIIRQPINDRDEDRQMENFVVLSVDPVPEAGELEKMRWREIISMIEK
jgi:hypothetical protein